MAARKHNEAHATQPLLSARERYETAATPAARAKAGARLAHELLMHEQGSAALALVEDLESALTPVETTSEVRRALAKVHEVHAQSLVATRTVEARRHVQTGLTILSTEQGPDAENERAWLWIEACTPLGIDSAAVDALCALAEKTALKPPVLVWTGIRAAELLKRRGDLRSAEARLEESAALTHLDQNSARVILDARGRAARHAGFLARAEALHHEAAAVFGPSGGGRPPGELELAICAHLRGELPAAREKIAALRDDPVTGQHADWLSLAIDLDEGRVAPALRGFRARIEHALAARDDKPLYDGARAYVDALLRADDAGALVEGEIMQADAVLSSAESVADAIATHEFPWYRVLFPALRGEVLSLSSAHRDTATLLLEGAYQRAATEWREAAPAHARTLVYALLRARKLDGAARVIDAAIPVARAQRNLRELARLQAARVAVLVHTASDPAVIRARMAELRLIIEETGAPRIAADALLDLARALPAASREPDPIDLLAEAAALFAAMPLPAPHARSLEAMGDVLVARGAPRDASLRYAEAAALLERHGLALRLPLLEKKRRALP